MFRNVHGDGGAIVIANNQLASTGTVIKSIEIAGALYAAGLPVELWVTQPAGSLAERVPAGVPLIVTGTTPGLPAAAGAVLALARTIRRRRPAVLFSGGKHFHLRAALALRLSGRRDATAFGGRASNSPERPGRGRLGRAIAQTLYLRKYGGMDFIVAVSRALADDLATRLAERGTAIRLIPNGVDRDRVASLARAGEEHPWAADPSLTVLTTMGRIDVQKGIDILLHAFARIARPSLRLVLIGAGSRGYMEEMRQLAASLGIAAQVDFAGYSANPFATIARSDLFVLASRWEGASNALLEALATGVPIVATDCPTGNAEILEGGRLGRLVPMEDPAALADAIVVALDAPEPLAPRDAALAKRSLDRCMAEYVALLANRRAAVLTAE